MRNILIFMLALGIGSCKANESVPAAPTNALVSDHIISSVTDKSAGEIPVTAPTEPQRPKQPAVDPILVSQIQDRISRIAAISQTGRRESEQMGDPGDVGQATLAAGVLKAQWETWARQWESRLDAEVNGWLAPTSSPMELMSAFTETDQAINSLRGVLQSNSDYAVPFKNQRKRCFDGADDHLQRARDLLARIAAS